MGRESLYTFDGVDAAIAKIDASAVASIIGLPTPTGTGRARDGMTVAKSGRTTGVTYGRVVDDGIEYKAAHWVGASGAIRFPGVIVVENRHRHFTDPGDSGSLVIDPEDETAIGMHFAGNNLTPKQCFALPIERVLRAFPQQMLVLPGESFP